MRKGFTLIEMVVVLAVVAILAAILTPTIMKNINDSKIARANNEVQVIGAAIASFYKDLGRWPTWDGSQANYADYIYLLYSANGSAMAYSGTNTHYWRNDMGWPAERKDTFENQLIANNPRNSGNSYPTTGELKWNGPYIAEIKADPWGSHYSCNIVYTYYTGNRAVWVFSAGSDRTATTRVDQNVASATLNDQSSTGDDIGVRIK